MLPVTLSMNHKCTDNQFPFTFFFKLYVCCMIFTLRPMFVYLFEQEGTTDHIWAKSLSDRSNYKLLIHQQGSQSLSHSHVLS